MAAPYKPRVFEEQTPFYSARLKLERAKHHINELNRATGAFLASGSHEITIEDDPSAGQRSLSIKRHKPVPLEFGLILGDAVHNMRASLDLLVWETLIPYKPYPSSSIQFPIGNDRDHYLKQAIPNRKITSAPKNIISAFNCIEAYPGGEGSLLHTLHHLDVSDKHKLLTPIISAAVIQDFSVEKVDPTANVIKMVSNGSKFLFINTELEKIISWPLSSHSTPLKIARKLLKEQTQRTKTFLVSFGAEPSVFAHKPVIPSLASMASRVEWAIDKIAAA